jgi:AraC-like DNA-binding protein
MVGLPDDCQVMLVTPLLRELIAQAITFDPLFEENGPEGRLIQVLLDCLRTAKVAPLHLPVPEQGPISEIATHLKKHPADDTSLEEWADQLGTTSRTLARNFKKHTNMTFGQWRQQARLLDALSRLANNQPIAHIAQDLGYSSQSAFSAMFKKALGTTPGNYFR